MISAIAMDANVRFWPDNDGLVSTVAMHGQTSVCSAISKASSTSIPRYRMVLSSFVWPRRSWTALRFFVLRYIRDAFVRRSVWVPYMAGSRPMAVTQALTIRAYCLVER
ncbi:hypothetical protein D3C84_42700 [compost metagenome]